MQDVDFIASLDNYKVLTHHNTAIQELIIDAIASKEFDATMDNIDEKIEKMYKLVDIFLNENN